MTWAGERVRVRTPDERHAGDRAARTMWLLAPGLLYVGVRGAGVGLLWVLSLANDVPFTLQRWDAGWYLQIAAAGYSGVDTGMTDAFGMHHDYTAMAFFPGYPLLLRLVAPEIPQIYLAAAVALSTVVGVVGAYGVARLASLCGGNRRAGLLAVALVAGAPLSVAYSMPYPESLLVSCVAWTLVAALRRRWLLAGVGALLAGLVDPMGGPVIVVVVVAALLDAFRERASWDAAVAAVLAPAGMLGYLLWVGERSGLPGGYFTITSQGWGNEFDFGARTFAWAADQLSSGREAFPVLTALLCLAASVALVVTFRRMPWPLWAYTAITLALVFGHGGVVTDRVRLLLSAFPLLVWVAVGLGRLRTATAVAATVSAAGFGLWFSAWALTAQPHSI
ncbi:hypothetical protein SacmaDRAFT_3077 [Saccharomonospora marina XMU15]|uniref:Integral membrane protein n=1 Tax=Saccharomonospora marina XMU15 TaxID=882083 RepID=H5X7M1_9PSEU|nr:hypothetical protein SacmaDRAFT_3077 [Saccharomonospora marina XMU15]